jgi:hypothetical protein
LEGKAVKYSSLLKNLFMLIQLIIFLYPISSAYGQQYSLSFDGTNDYVTFGQATSTLGAQTFTIECWFKWTGGGVTTSTGTGGLTTVIPLITKGRGEADGSNLDMNYFLGIQSSKLAADFEDIDGASIDGDAAGQNQPIIGNTTITTNTWHHAAATFDGTYWKLYLDGVLDNTLDVTNPGYSAPRPQFNSIQHAGIGTAMTSTGSPAGYFSGIIDEARIWNYARSQSDIQSGMITEVTSGTGLLGRWGLNDGSGTTALNSISGSPTGTLTNGPVWKSESPYIHDALKYGSSTAYVTFGNNSDLRLARFTLECWFKRDGAGTTANTGTGGMYAIPLITKGVGENEKPDTNMNYFL